MLSAHVSLQQIHLVVKDAFRSLFAWQAKHTNLATVAQSSENIQKSAFNVPLTQDGSTAQLHLILTQVGRIVVIVVKYRPGYDIIYCNCNENVGLGLNPL